MNKLHITNGDGAANIMREAGIAGEILPWRDCLFEGPVPQDISLAELTKVRAHYLAHRFGLPKEDILQDMQQRDQILANYQQYEEVVLWFEHDLYDQLQLLQLLDFFCTHYSDKVRVSLICVGEFPGIEPFYGLGQLDAKQMATLIGSQQPLTPVQLQLGQRAWQVFRCPEPDALQELIIQDLTALPFLKAALIRLMQEYPSMLNGLSRTEQQLVSALADGPKDPVELFIDYQSNESAPYLGDTGFWAIAKTLMDKKHPLLERVGGGEFVFPPTAPYGPTFRQQKIQLTDLGHKVLSGETDRIESCGVDYWLGGAHIVPEFNWRWNDTLSSIVNTSSGQ